MTALTTLENEGRVWFRGSLSDAELLALNPICALGAAPGARIVASHDVIAALAPVDRLAQNLLPSARPVRIVAFNKSDARNWALPWHQDRVIAVRNREEVSGFSNWTKKSGVWHVEPPIDLMQRMLFLRIHLDPSNVDNGCLEIAPGSHARGLIAAEHAGSVANASTTEHCMAARGDVLAAKALILHRSGASQSGTSRRAIRIDYSAEQLPAPLEWEFSS